jgi:RiboL-PSP-HEPN
MPSDALSQLEQGLDEVRQLRGYAGQFNSSIERQDRLQFIITARRACVVLLCSHYERYLYGLNESFIDVLNQTAPQPDRLPTQMLLRQIKMPLETLATKEWTQREPHLRQLFEVYSSHWIPGQGVTGLDAQSNIAWMKSPKVQEIIRLFRLFGIENIISEVTRTDAGRRNLTRELQGLVDARNGIAHGDQTIQPTGPELTRYLDTVAQFCDRADRCVSRSLAKSLGLTPPW